MFILGLVVGPCIGLLAGDLLFRTWSSGPIRGTATVVLLLLFVLFAPFFALELKLGIIVGFLLGLLLVLTPMAQERAEDLPSPE